MGDEDMTTAIAPRQMTLDELADIANSEHHQVETALGSVLEHAMASGAALIKAKAQLKRGEWLPWLAEHFEGSQPTAWAYMKVAANYKHADNLPDSIRAALRLIAGADDTPHVAKNSGDNEWYTPEPYVEAARDVLGGFDLDPASTDVANETVGATNYYTADDDGLEQEWGGRVWMNPPYAKDKIGPFTEKLAASYESGSVEAAIALVNNATETEWFQRLARTASAICFPDGRVRFRKADGELGAPLQGQAILYLGDDTGAFATRFAEVGLIVEVRP